MKKSAIYILLIIFSNSLLFAQANPQQIFKEANQYYAQKDYVKAIEKYENLIKQGNFSANIYYNLANAYYRNNNIGKAILYYHKAKRLNPNDEDINANLQLAKLKSIDKIQPIPQFFLSKWIENISKSQSPETFGIIAIIFSFIGFGLLTIYIYARKSGTKKLSFFGSIAALIIMILFIITAFQSNTYRTSDKEAVIISASAYIKSSPDQTATDLFILHEGTEIEVLDKVANWSKIRIANGNQGWIEDGNFEII